MILKMRYVSEGRFRYVTPPGLTDALYLADISCVPGEIEKLNVDKGGENCGISEVLVRLCMNAAIKGKSLHTIENGEDGNNRAMVNLQKFTTTTHLFGCLKRNCGKVLRAPMLTLPASEPWAYFNSAMPYAGSFWWMFFEVFGRLEPKLIRTGRIVPFYFPAHRLREMFNEQTGQVSSFNDKGDDFLHMTSKL